MKRPLAAFLAASILTLSLPAPAALTTLSNLFVFGDSLSDGGNSGLLTQSLLPPNGFPPPPYAGGRYSNGPVAVEYLWQSYHPGSTSFTPSLAGGTNYAIGGATTGVVNFNSINSNVPPPLQPSFNNLGLASQLAQFQTFVAGGGTFNRATSLFVVWAFPNDVFWALQTGQLPDHPGVPATPAALVTQGVQNIVGSIALLASLGAEHFLVPNMADLGETPFGLAQGPGGSAMLTGLTEGFNGALGGALSALPTLDIVQFDTFGAFRELRDNPAAFGFTNATQACVQNPATCDPNTWVFWDQLHPTTATHRILGTEFAAAVPEPSTIVLVATLLLLMGVAVRMRRTPRCRWPAR